LVFTEQDKESKDEEAIHPRPADRQSAGLVGATAIVFLLLNPHPVASISSASSCSLRAL